MPDIGLIGLSFSRSLGSWSMDPGFFFALIGSAAAESDKQRPSVRNHEKAPALHLARKARGTRNENQGNDTETRANGQRRRRAVASCEAGSGAKRKKGPGGRRNALITLDSAKENQGFPLLYFGRALLDEVRIWLNFDLPLKKLILNRPVQLYRAAQPYGRQAPSRSRVSMTPSPPSRSPAPAVSFGQA